jgi:hypothetical protein
MPVEHENHAAPSTESQPFSHAELVIVAAGVLGWIVWTVLR